MISECAVTRVTFPTGTAGNPIIGLRTIEGMRIQIIPILLRIRSAEYRNAADYLSASAWQSGLDGCPLQDKTV